MLGKEPYIPKKLRRALGGAIEAAAAVEPLIVKRLPENVELRIRKQVQQRKKR
jgi:hypothetical protein